VGGKEGAAASTQLYPLTSVMSANRGCHSHWHLDEAPFANHPAVPPAPPLLLHCSSSAPPAVPAVDVTRFITHSLAANTLPSYPLSQPTPLSHSAPREDCDWRPAHFDPCTMFPCPGAQQVSSKWGLKPKIISELILTIKLLRTHSNRSILHFFKIPKQPHEINLKS